MQYLRGRFVFLAIGFFRWLFGLRSANDLVYSLWTDLEDPGYLCDGMTRIDHRLYLCNPLW